MNVQERYAALVRSFPVLRDAPGVGITYIGEGAGWVPKPEDDGIGLAELDTYGMGQFRSRQPGSGARCAVAFVLYLWSGRHLWKAQHFDLREAWGCWDDAQRAAWQAWAADPWWP